MIRFLTFAEMATLAARIEARAAAGKTVHLAPPSALACQRALIATLNCPARPEVMAIICGKRDCSLLPLCASCMMKANAIMHLYEEAYRKALRPTAPAAQPPASHTR